MAQSILEHPDLKRRDDLQHAPAAVPFSQEQFCALNDLHIRIEAMTKLLNVADFGWCECQTEAAGARLIAREVDDAVRRLYLDLFVAFRDQSVRKGGYR